MYVRGRSKEYSQTQANANRRTQTCRCDGTRGLFLHANAVAICTLDLKLSVCTIYTYVTLATVLAGIVSFFSNILNVLMENT